MGSLNCELTTEQAALVTTADKAVVGVEHTLKLSLDQIDPTISYRVIEVASATQMGSHDNALVGEVVATDHLVIPKGWFILVRWREGFATLIASGHRMSLGAGSPPQQTKPGNPHHKRRRKGGRGNQNAAPPTSGPIPL